MEHQDNSIRNNASDLIMEENNKSENETQHNVKKLRKLHQCKVCDKLVTKLKQHMRVPSQEKPYQCKVCDKHLAMQAL